MTPAEREAYEHRAQEVWKATVDADNKRWAAQKRRERAEAMERYWQRFGRPPWVLPKRAGEPKSRTSHRFSF